MNSESSTAEIESLSEFWAQLKTVYNDPTEKLEHVESIDNYTTDNAHVVELSIESGEKASIIDDPHLDRVTNIRIDPASDEQVAKTKYDTIEQAIARTESFLQVELISEL